MTPSLIALPGEILNSILFKTDFTHQDHCALSRVCKPLRRLTLPHIFEAVVFTWTTGPSGVTKLHSFLRAFFDNQRLSGLVKHFRCIGGNRKRLSGTLWQEGAIKTLEDDKLIKMAKNVVYTAELPEPLLWINALEMGNIDAFLALHLSQLLHLQSLDLDLVFTTNNRFIGLLFKHVVSSDNQSLARRCLSAFAHLQQVGFVVARPEPVLPIEASVDVDQISSLFYFPAVETLDLFTLFHGVEFSWPKDNPPCASHLKTLHFPQCDFDEHDLRKVLSVTPNLERLSYHRLYDIDPLEDSPPTSMNLAILCDALDYVYKTLRHLSISISSYAKVNLARINWQYHGIIGLPSSFAHFEKLEYLEMPFVILFGDCWGALPGTDHLMPRFLKHLCLRDDLSDLITYAWSPMTCIAQIRELLESRDRITPYLESITLRLTGTEEGAWDEEWDEDEQSKLRYMCSLAGVDCSISRVPPG